MSPPTRGGKYIYIYILRERGRDRERERENWCKLFNDSPIYKWIHFYFFKLRENFIEKQKLQNLFLSDDFSQSVIILKDKVKINA